MALMFCGDLHGEKKSLSIFLNSDVKTLVQLGDFGFIWKWSDLQYNRFLRQFGKDFPEKEILFVPGNHENYNAIFSCPVVEIYGGRARKITNNCYALERGETYTIDGKRILAIGGAYSVDKEWRIPNVSWWEQELPRVAEMERILANLKDVDKIDYLVAHTCPFSIIEKQLGFFYKENPAMEKFFDVVYQEVKGKVSKWYFGHWHTSFSMTENGTEFRCFDIDEFKKE